MIKLSGATMQPVHRSDQVAATPAPQRQTVLWIIALLLAVIATTLIVRTDRGPIGIPTAFADSPMAGARGIFAFTGQIDTNRYGLFMMDVDTRNVWCYEYMPGTRKMRLVFARSFDFDRYLEGFNLDKETTPEMIKKLLEEQRKNKDRIRNNGGRPDDADEVLGTSIPGLNTPEEAEPTSTKPSPTP